MPIDDGSGRDGVPDASVILKWVLDSATEPGHAAAQRLLARWQEGDLSLFAPQLWVYEVGNVLCLKRPQDAAEALDALRSLGLIEVAFDRGLIQATVTLAKSYGITFYDASYLAVAQEKNAVLVTADARFYRRLPAGLPVELLAEN
jgi:predicted nucleic acid-binding protein